MSSSHLLQSFAAKLSELLTTYSLNDFSPETVHLCSVNRKLCADLIWLVGCVISGT